MEPKAARPLGAFKYLAAPAALFLSACTSWETHPSYWHLSIPVKAEMRGEPAPEGAGRVSRESVPTPAEPERPARETSPAREDAERKEAERLIREAVPLFSEVADTWAGKPTSKSELGALLTKAKKVERLLSSALVTYISLTPREHEKEAIERRMRRLQELLTSIRTWVQEVEGAL